MTLDWTPLIAKNRLRFQELEEIISQGDLFADPDKARVTLREHSRLKKLIEQADLHEKIRRQLEENREMASGDDPEMAELAAAEIPELETRLETVATDIQLVLLPPEAADNRNAIVEIRAGAGGNEAALFAADLCRMYSRYAETKGWRIEEMESSPAELGGLKEIILLVSGEAVFRDLRYESGVHRVQRVPLTEAQGRIHTSAATVAVLPEAEEVDVEIRPDDLRIEVCRAGGPGGQGVNTTDSAVQILHIPTGKIVRCQDGRSQQKNKEKALKILRARLLEEKQAEEHEKYAAHRRSQIGTGGREEKIRTYNFPQNRVTDHRIGYTMYNLEAFVQGDLDTMLRSLQIKDMENKLLDALEAA